MPFGSVLFERPEAQPENRAAIPPAPPPFFADLKLDQIAAALTRGLEQYDLIPYFRTPLPDESAIVYRHQVFRDLRRPEVREVVTGFARQMTAMRQSLTRAGQLRHPYQQQRWCLDAAGTYGRAVQ